VDDDMANLIVAQLLYLDAADPNRVCSMCNLVHECYASIEDLGSGFSAHHCFCWNAHTELFWRR